MIVRILCVLALAAAAGQAQSSAVQGGAPESPLREAMDESLDPCEDFYQYACGSWLAENKIPPDESRWSRFNELVERNREILRDILEQQASRGEERTPIEQKIGDYYASCMDEEAIEEKGLAAVEDGLARIDSIDSREDLIDTVIHLHRIGVNALFRTDSVEDFKDATRVIAEVDQGGLGLPDRDYYFREDEKSVETRKKYVEHAGRMFKLAGASEQEASQAAGKVMEIETALAEGSLDRVSRRNPENVYHKWPAAKLAGHAPALGWERYFDGVGAPEFESLNVAVPEFFAKVEELMGKVPLADWKIYLRWRLLSASAPLLPEAFVNEDFSFYGKTLQGTQQLKPRWKRCVSYTDSGLGEALGQEYVERTFSPEAKQRMLELVGALEKALEEDIRKLDWMGAETKSRAIEKLHAVTNKIGYPDEWRDYSRLKIVRGDALGNSQRANTFDFERRLGKIGKPVDKEEWFMSPPTVNAYYHPLHNNINFPAGILQPPFFYEEMDDAVNLGAIGVVIGHELTHGFDDQGRKFDAQGNLEDWWTGKDARRFEERAECFEKQYAEYLAVDDVKLNGKLTLGENTADNGGARIAYMALRDLLEGQPRKKIEGFTPEQRFFISYGQIWCMHMTDEAARMRAQVDPHSPGRYRVNGVVSNTPEFHTAFECEPGDAMVRKQICRVW